MSDISFSRGLPKLFLYCLLLLVFVSTLTLVFNNYGLYNITYYNFQLPRHDEKFVADMKQALSKQRNFIHFEMDDYNFTNHNYSSLSDLIPELGGRPRRSVLVTTWRSGSTFLGGILNSHPGNWYHYEPLLHLDIVQIRGPPLDSIAYDTIYQLLRCNYTGQGASLEYGKKDKDVFQYNDRLWQHCKSKSQLYLCYEPEFLNSMCNLFPIQSMKVVRTRLTLVEDLLRDKSLGVKMIFMVRDPRGTMQSRLKREWCPSSPDCMEAELLCADLKSNFYAAVQMAKRYPNRFRVLRYEDFSSDPYKSTEDLFKFLDINSHNNVISYLNTHTKINSGGEWSTFRNSKDTFLNWRKKIDFKYAEHIQNVCKDAMKLWGYYPAHNESHMKSFNPLGSFYFQKSDS